MLSNNHVRDRFVELEVFLQHTRCLGQTHSCVGDQGDQPTQIVVQSAALSLQHPNGFDWHRCPVFNSGVSVIVDPAEGIGDVDPHLTGSKVDHRANGTENAGDTTPSQTALDQIVTEAVGIGFGVGGDVFVAANVDRVAAGALSCPVESDRTSPAFQAKIDGYSFGKLHRRSGRSCEPSYRRCRV